MSEPRILFCLSGGGLAGLDIHVGIWLALEEAGIVSTANCGTSAGSIMAALNSTGWKAAQAEALIRYLNDDDVRQERFAWKLRMPWIDSFLDPAPIEKLLRNLLPADFSLLQKPLTVFSTVDETGDAAVFGTLPGQTTQNGDIVSKVIASMSIAGVFPPRNTNGVFYSDGGTTNQPAVPLDWAEYDEVYLCVAEPPLSHYVGTENMLTRLMRNAQFFENSEVDQAVEEMTNGKEMPNAESNEMPNAECRVPNWRQSATGNRQSPIVRVLRPPVRATLGSLHFDHGLINEAKLWTEQQLAANDADQAQPPKIKKL
jgi:predicted acylesterase/phospholipase RssA